MGTINNLIHVKKSDFEVFDALKVDSLESSETSGRGEFCGIRALHVLFPTSCALRLPALGAQTPGQRCEPALGVSSIGQCVLLSPQLGPHPSGGAVLV